MFSSLKDISGAPSFTGGAAAPSQAIGGTASATQGGDIFTGGSSKGLTMPSIYWIGAAALIFAVSYRIYKKAKK